MVYKRHEATVPVAEYVEKHVRFDTTYACCEACHNFRMRWSCPPYDFDPPADIWAQYDELTVVCYQIFSLDAETDRVTSFRRAASVLDADTGTLEKKTPGSLALSAGSCHLCETCARPDGLPCRFPDKMRYSIESLGGIVDATVKELFGFDLLWATDEKEPDYYTLVGGLLKKKEV